MFLRDDVIELSFCLFQYFWLNLLLSTLIWFPSQNYHGRKLLSMTRETLWYNHLCNIMSRFYVYWGLSCEITENGKMTTIWSHPLKTGHDMKNKFFQNISLVMLNNFYHYKQLLPKMEIKSKCTKKRQNDGYMTSYAKNGTWHE